MTTVAVALSRPAVAVALRAALAAQNITIADDAPILLTDDPAHAAPPGVAIIVLGDAPVRLGALLDRLARATASGPQIITFGPYSLETADGLLERAGHPPLRLTGKERDLLVRLHAAGEAVERDDLLSEIWGYADGVETHTLETHVYRLRQKIEDDPAHPRWLLTEGSAYRLGGVESLA